MLAFAFARFLISSGVGVAHDPFRILKFCPDLSAVDISVQVRDDLFDVSMTLHSDEARLVVAKGRGETEEFATEAAAVACLHALLRRDDKCIEKKNAELIF